MRREWKGKMGLWEMQELVVDRTGLGQCPLPNSDIKLSCTVWYCCHRVLEKGERIEIVNVELFIINYLLDRIYFYLQVAPLNHPCLP
jgi:hypothetical protein